MNLYRLFDGKHRLLYVGISASAIARFSQHTAQKPWASEVAHISVEHYPTRREAEEAERLAIQTEFPRYNIQHRVVVPAERPVVVTQPARLAWTCERCDSDIADGDGVVVLLADEILRHAHEERIWTARKAEQRRNAAPGSIEASHEIEVISGEDWRYLPEAARWLIAHWTCLREDESPSYEVTVERARSADRLLDWTAHLMEKRWIGDTDWPDLIRRAQCRNRAIDVNA